jgi:hypothetical protein
MNIQDTWESLFGPPQFCLERGNRCDRWWCRGLCTRRVHDDPHHRCERHAAALSPPPPAPDCWRCGEPATAYKVWFRVLEEAVWDHSCTEHATKLTLAT